ncbi:putative ankyrin repeat protein RF_0381 isoform X1 [Saccostrea echinata]|uniref:putative ankyrin repeat protein RF_0381 isoform X1 n=1 Tax=Saccostrea echinata TaxID=191078 RepID=UPI002A83182D|nr:putative ankyrin repeat protein RF_0381 isoform X1 [Saccostrea echinata]
MAGAMPQLASTKIGQAIKNGDFRELKRLIDSGENVHLKDRKGNTYLHYVCTMYRPVVFHIIAAQGIDINSQNKFGYTPLHVTALQKDGLHIADVMCCGADPDIKCYLGKTAAELDPHNKYWQMVYEKYKPGIFHAVKAHDVEKVKELLHCWCKMDSKYNGLTLRQYSAAHKHHDIVRILDQHKATLDVIYGCLELNYDRVRAALKKSWCRINFLNKASRKQHILQFAIEMRDNTLVKMLCDAGADVNMLVLVHDYFVGPLYFEVINTSTPPDIMWTVLKANVNFNIKDERGRNAMTYALDKGNGFLPTEVFKFMLRNGAYLGDRDDTGVGVREIAKFARRMDVGTLIDKYYIQVIRNSDLDMLRRLAVDGYGGLLINFNYRDSYIYAAGNDTDDVLKFIEWLPTFQEQVRLLHLAIREEPLSEFSSILQSCSEPELLINSKDKGLRSPLILATLFARDDVVNFILKQPYKIDINAQDCCKRTAYHYTYFLDLDGESIRKSLIEAGIDQTLLDVKGKRGEDYAEFADKEEWIDQEITAKYGMELELMCIEKYEDLRKVIRSKKQGLKEFIEQLRDFPVPVATFPKILGPLMSDYRDIIFLAVDYGKEDIAVRLAHLGADLFRKELYIRKSRDGEEVMVAMDVVERAATLKMVDLVNVLAKKQVRQREIHTPLVPRRAQVKLQLELSMKSVDFEKIFVSQTPLCFY